MFNVKPFRYADTLRDSLIKKKFALPAPLVNMGKNKWKHSKNKQVRQKSHSCFADVSLRNT